MDVTNLIVTTVVICIAIGICFYFVLRNRSIRKEHSDYVCDLEQEIGTHRFQIDHRQKGLLVYRFLEYNLDEALVIQYDIKI